MSPVPAALLPAPVAAPPAAAGSTRAPAFVRAAWLAEHLNDVRVIDTRRIDDYLAGHVPGSVSFALDALLIEDTSAVALDRLAIATRAALAARGVAADSHVVLVDDTDGSASLGALVCELAGVASVSVLLGGTAGWASAAQEFERTPAQHPPIELDAWNAVGVPPARRSLVAFEDLHSACFAGTAHIVDARSQLEHEGIVGAPCCSERGAIPGSIHLEWTALFDMCDRPHEHQRVLDIAAHVGMHPDDPVIVTCHAGHRAAVAARVLRDAGFTDVRVSLGSWHEWSAKVGMAEDSGTKA